MSYCFYDIRQELINKPSIINCFLRTSCPILGHHQGCVYCKSDVTFETQKIREKLESFITLAQLHKLDNRLSIIINKNDYQHKLTFQKMLNNLCKGHVLLPNNIDKYINLLDCNLTQQQKDFFKLGPNCHLFP